MSYVRDGDRVSIEWYPDDEASGQKAVTDVVGEPDEWPAKVSNDEASRIRERYAEITSETK